MKKEKDFSRELTSFLHKAGFSTTRIESHGTEVGIPDMFVQGHGIDFFLELKNSNVDTDKPVVVFNWRPGQQNWMYNYYKEHKLNKMCLTLKCEPAAIYAYTMTKMQLTNAVPIDEPSLYMLDKFWFKQLKPKHVFLLLKALTSVEAIEACTYREALINYVNKYFAELDYDPEILWYSINPQWNCCPIGLDEAFDKYKFAAALPELVKELINYERAMPAVNN